ncbi:uncharacterized protein MYCFIDRAFT_78033 [Pseudocercospora fijiensis CIRAD86]|uniref:Uncharacterized protein n=1 Tax=Pseudocercospora fijiensis (strain CIRAD86) TaxID=383855 RepID=M3AT36_PSEFD|nr:uncharacterized protein MYCFIDRAFT_78033 [Pseudocercospora fijiensis CIRAD86]EME80278.1 hypothetical protein MYCFIDRAFT_78033 [Pseudocercospora fijiensis CIRAD86]
MDAFQEAINGQDVFATTYQQGFYIPPERSDHADMPCRGARPTQVAADLAAMIPSSNAPQYKVEQFSDPATPSRNTPEVTPDHEDHGSGSSALFIKQSPHSSPPTAQHSFREERHPSLTPSVNTGSKEDPIDIDDNRESMAPAPVAPPRSRKGRSLGENSTKHIRDLRAQAEGGSIEAALKLGWSVERMTVLFNQDKLRRGVPTAMDTPIDDENLLARIEQRKENGREASKRRAHKLKVRANQGDFEAAKKLKLSNKTMSTMFPNHTEEFPLQQKTERAVSPTEPLHFQQHSERRGTVTLGASNHPTPRLAPRYPSQTHAQALPAAPTFRSEQSWGNLTPYGMQASAFQKTEVHLLTARDEWMRMAAIAHSQAQALDQRLRQHLRLREDIGMAVFDAIAPNRKPREQELKWIQESGQEDAVVDSTKAKVRQESSRLFPELAILSKDAIAEQRRKHKSTFAEPEVFNPTAT